MNIKIIFQFVAVFVLSVLVPGAIGLFVGMDLGGSFGAGTGGGCTTVKGTLVCDEGEEGFTYMGQVGWEGGGLLGLHLGVLAGVGLGTYIWKTRFGKKSS